MVFMRNDPEFIMFFLIDINSIDKKSIELIDM
jgi:hypothetical protein